MASLIGDEHANGALRAELVEILAPLLADFGETIEFNQWLNPDS
jgi:hypothetical protein